MKMQIRTEPFCSEGNLVLNYCLELVPSQFGGHNAPITFFPEHNSQASIPATICNVIVPTQSEDGVERASKRYRLAYEQANAALEAPSTYQDAMASLQPKMWGGNQDRIDGT